MKTEEDLEKTFEKMEEFIEFNKSFYFLIDKGMLAEFYCMILFNLKKARNVRNSSPDLLSRKGKKLRYEVKHRKIKKVDLRKIIKGVKIPRGMKVYKNKIDYLLYVYMDTSGSKLPLCIFKINKKDLFYTNKSKNIVSFSKAFEGGVANKIIYKDTKFFDTIKW